MRRLVAIYQSDTFAVGLSVLTITLSLDLLHKVVDRRTTMLTALDKQIAARRRELAELEIPLSPAPAGTYPGREDLDPLHLEGDDRG